MAKTLCPADVEELQEMVRATSGSKLIPFGGKTKMDWFTQWDSATWIDMKRCFGVVDYQPSDFTITVSAGTLLSDLKKELDASGQFMPFDPPWIEAGSTVGGMVSTGVNGPCKQLWGGIRDFILAIEFVDGQGDFIRAGARVVKNAAGFDLPKYSVGAQGQFGILTSVTLKVFPRPRGWRTLCVRLPSMERCLKIVSTLGSQPMDIAALDFDPILRTREVDLFVRIVGSQKGLQSTSKRLEDLLTPFVPEWIDGSDEEQSMWDDRRDRPLGVNLKEPGGGELWRITCSPSRIPKLESLLDREGVLRQYSHSGNSVWVLLEDPSTADLLHSTCLQTQLDGLKFKHGGSTMRRLGPQSEINYWNRVRRALDQEHSFATW